MEGLNYHHLHYFWVVAREGGVTRASEVLHTSQPTISSQLRLLEQAVGHALFERTGRSLKLTAMGQLVFRYADEIFAIGRELSQAIKGQPTDRPTQLHAGIVNVLPKIVTYQILAPTLHGDPPVHMVCHEDTYDGLLAKLAIHQLDIMLADAPVAPGAAIKAFNHLLGESQVAFFGLPEVVQPLRQDFPHSLATTPLVLPVADSALRRSVDQWLDSLDLSPPVTAECDDSALIKTFARHGEGLCIMPTVVEREMATLGLVRLAVVPGLVQRFYGITTQRRQKQAAVQHMIQTARQSLLEAGAAS